MFRPPPTTSYDLNFSFAGFPVRVHPLFWLIGILFGASLGRLDLIVIWVIVLFISIFIHEFGHALVMRGYGVDSLIVLYHFGGLAVPTSSRRTSLEWLEQIAISLAGPFAGFLFAALVAVLVNFAGGIVVINWFLGFIPIPSAFLPSMSNLINNAIQFILWINVFWGLINLLPVFPLDGGRVSQQIFVRFDPWNGIRNSLWLSVITGAIVAIVGFVVLDSIYMAFLFGILAVQSYQMI